jgi:hypothetical protein
VPFVLAGVSFSVTVCGSGPAHIGVASLGQSTTTTTAKMLAQLLQFSECVRSHGITQFPDPQSINGKVRLVFTPSMGIDPNSPQFQAAQKACQKFNPIPAA